MPRTYPRQCTQPGILAHLPGSKKPPARDPGTRPGVPKVVGPRSPAGASDRCRAELDPDQGPHDGHEPTRAPRPSATEQSTRPDPARPVVPSALPHRFGRNVVMNYAAQGTVGPVGHRPHPPAPAPPGQGGLRGVGAGQQRGRSTWSSSSSGSAGPPPSSSPRTPRRVPSRPCAPSTRRSSPWSPSGWWPWRPGSASPSPSRVVMHVHPASPRPGHRGGPHPRLRAGRVDPGRHLRRRAHGPPALRPAGPVQLALGGVHLRGEHRHRRARGRASWRWRPR